MNRFLFLMLLSLFTEARASEVESSCVQIQDVLTRKVIYKQDIGGICDERLSPFSSFKIALAVMAFDHGVLLNPKTKIRWDHSPQPFPTWERDQDAFSWLRDSVVWVSQKLTPEIGAENIKDDLNRFHYGNADFSGGLTLAWLGSTLKISATEQMNFLRRLRWNFFDLHEDSVEKLIAALPVAENAPHLKIYGKTGSSSRSEKPFKVGWYVGYIEKNGRLYSFASVLKDNSPVIQSEYGGGRAKAKLLASLPRIAFLDPLRFGKKQRIQDFEQLKKMVSQYYPNLETKVKNDHLDLVTLNHETLKRLTHAKTETDAMIALEQFLHAFRDGHLDFDWPTLFRATDLAEPQKTASLTRDTHSTEACKQFPVEKSLQQKFAFPVTEALGFSMPKKPSIFFDQAVLNLAGKKVGFIRIHSFQWQDFPSVCEDEWERYRSEIKTECDQTCKDRFTDYVIPNRLIKELEVVISGLQEQKIDSLVLDVTDNGGGNDWVEAVARVLTDKALVCGKHAFVKSQLWVKNLEAKIKEDESAQSIEKLALDNRLLQGAKLECDRSAVWTKRNFLPKCTVLVDEGLKNECSPSSDFKYHAGLYHGPLMILANHNSASATEELIARYQDSGVGTLIGEKTFGAGCGHTNGGFDLKLKNSGIKISIPDCARFLRDGYNEVEGFIPKARLRMGRIDSQEFVMELKKYLSGNDEKF